MPIEMTPFKQLFDEGSGTITDYFRGEVPAFLAQDALAKEKLLDSMRAGKQKLMVTIPLSASDKMINRRIYPQSGQKKGIKSWVEPYSKPVLLHHDSYRDPIGRVEKVWYEPRDYISDFKDMRSYSEFKRKIKSRDAQVIYEALYESGKLLDTNWKGTGLLMGLLGISDADATEKLIDGRYLTGSAGARSNHWFCSHCGTDWMQDEYCEHYPGSIIDGKPVVSILGDYLGKEFSFVNDPAHEGSAVTSMEFSDSVGSIPEIFGDLNVHEDDIIDFKQEFIMKPKVITDPTKEVGDNQDENEQDALSLDAIRAIVGELIDSKLATFEFPKATLESTDGADENTADDEDEASANSSTEEDTLVIDWKLLDLALGLSVPPEDRLSEDELKNLDDDAFCSTDRLFPIANKIYGEAAKELIAKTTLADSNKTSVIELIDARLALLEDSTASDSRLADLEQRLNDMQQNYANALTQLEKLQKQLDNPTDLGQDGTEDESVSDREAIDKVDNPQNVGTVDGAEDSSTGPQGAYAKKAVKQYQKLLASDGEEAAQQYAVKVQGFLPKEFDFKKYIQ